MTIDFIYDALLWGALFAMSLSTCFCLFRAILGPRFTDRIIAVNIVCTKAIIAIAILAFLFGQDFLLDIALVYAMISFLAVVVLSKCYLLKHQEHPVDPELEAEHAHAHGKIKEEAKA